MLEPVEKNKPVTSHYALRASFYYIQYISQIFIKLQHIDSEPVVLMLFLQLRKEKLILCQFNNDSQMAITE